jgi:hypothetical protein
MLGEGRLKMHGHSNWINYVLSGAMFLVTGVLAWATWKYMRFTKRMADAMETQTAIMSEGYERNIAPLCKPIFNYGSTSAEETKIRYLIYNYGKEPFSVIKVMTNIWNVNNPDLILQQEEKVEDVLVLPSQSGSQIDILFKLKPDVLRYYPDKEKQIKFEATFLVKDVKSRDYSFPAGTRSFYF